MTARDLDAQIDCTAEHNQMVPLVLGMMKILDDIAARVEDGPDDNAAGFDNSARDEEIVRAVLGLLSLRRTLHRWIGQVEPASGAAKSPAGKSMPAGEGLLR